MKLVLYSDNISPLNRIIDSEIARMTKKKIIRAVMILASKDVENFMTDIFEKFLEDNFIKVNKTIVNSWDSGYDKEAIKLADLIFLSGGDTNDFAQNINNTGMKEGILTHVKQNRVLVGASAGSILMTPTIGIRKPKGKINNEEDTLNLVKFEVEPHYTPEKDIDLISYSKQNGRPIYALTDGSAIVIDGIKEKMLGTVYLFTNGDKALVTCNC